MKRIHKKKIANVAIIAMFTLSLFAPVVVSQSIQDLQEDINSKQSELDDVEQQRLQAEEELASAQSNLSSSSSELDILQAEIDALEKEIALNEFELELLETQIELKQLERTERELRRDESLESSYKDWRVQDVQQYKILGEGDTIEKNREYDSFLVEIQQKEIYELLLDLQNLDTLLDDYDNSLAELEEKNRELQDKKAQLEIEIAALQNAVNASYSNIGALDSQADNIQNQISQLEEEQKAAFEREREILEQDSGGGGGDVQDGEWYFYGAGRDLYQGHGVGFSQWGAHGLGLNGYSYQDIATFYYNGATISGGYNNTINVQGYGDMTLDEYAAGLAEIPSRACGSSEQVTDNPSKYVVDNPNTPWDCWPEEAIKAQVVVAKTYALWYTSVYGSICTTAVCQVYEGGNAKQWAVEETTGQVVTYAGAPIEAVYSSDNSQGYGTADNDTIWQNFVGDGSPYPYLRAINDTGLATTTSWTNWGYQTNGFTASDLDELFEYVANGNAYSNSVKSEMQGIINSIDTVQSINFVRDNSLRVKKVEVTGTTGQSRTIGGWWFKNIWNSWAYDTGRLDYLYSQTFFLSQ